ncbi:MAG: hypothetical protein AAFX85_18550 [Pseudomonadota bacterium]
MSPTPDDDTPRDGAANWKLYETLVDQLKREESLTNQRLSWMLTTQGFLFASMAIGAREKETLGVFLKVIPVVGVTIAFAGLLGLVAATLSRRQYKRIYLQTFGDRREAFPRPFAEGLAQWFGTLAAWGIPIVLISGWVAVAWGLRG